MRDPFPFLYPDPPRVPAGLMTLAAGLRPARVALVDAGAETPMRGMREAAELGLAEPILIGDGTAIREVAARLEWDIDGVRVIEASHDEATATAAELARTDEADAVMKGQLHSSTFLRGLLSSRAGLRDAGARCGHVFHITAPGHDRPLLLTDGALNVDPDVATRQECLRHAVALARRLDVETPRAAILSANEDPLPSVPNSMEAAEIAEWAKDALPEAAVAGPMALDLIFSAEAARIKGFESPVCGDADIVVVPNITSGNAIFKLMVLGMGCCAAGLVLGARVPILLTSRSQGPASRIASAALANIVGVRE